MLIFAMSTYLCLPFLPTACGRPCWLPSQHPFSLPFPWNLNFHRGGNGSKLTPARAQAPPSVPLRGAHRAGGASLAAPRNTASLAPRRSPDSLRPLSLQGSEMTAAQGLSPEGQPICSAPHRAFSSITSTHPVWDPNSSTPRTQEILDRFLPHTGVCLFLFTEKKVHNTYMYTYARRPQSCSPHGGLPLMGWGAIAPKANGK